MKQVRFGTAVSFDYDEQFKDELKQMGGCCFEGYGDLPRSYKEVLWVIPRDKEPQARAAAMRCLGTDGQTCDVIDIVLFVPPRSRIPGDQRYLNFKGLALASARWNGSGAEPLKGVEVISGEMVRKRTLDDSWEVAYEAPAYMSGIIRVRDVSRTRALELGKVVRRANGNLPVRDVRFMLGTDHYANLTSEKSLALEHALASNEFEPEQRVGQNPFASIWRKIFGRSLRYW